MICRRVGDSNPLHFLVLPNRSGLRRYDLWLHIGQGWVVYEYNIRTKREAKARVHELRADPVWLYELEQLLGPEAGRFRLHAKPMPPGVGGAYYSEFVQRGKLSSTLLLQLP